MDDAKKNARYGLIRSLDNTETIGATLARYVRFSRSFDTLNDFYRVYDALTPADLQAAARKYFDDTRLVVTTLARDPLPAGIDRAPSLSTLGGAPAAEGAPAKVVQVPSALPQVRVKLLFRAGSAHDPAGKEGLAALAAAMIAEAGSRERRIDEIRQAVFPMAGSFDAQVDKEMTTFTASVHRDNWPAFAQVVLPMLLDPGFREEDFRRLKDAQANALAVDLRSNNEEELGKERLQSWLFAGTPYGHPALGTVDGIAAITLDDVRDFVRRAYTRSALTIGVSGDVPADFTAGLQRDLARLPGGPALPKPAGVAARRPRGIEVDVV